MKTLYIPLLVLTGCSMTAEDMKRTESIDTTFSQICEVPGAEQKTLHNNAKQFILANIVSDRSVLDYEDQNTLVANGNMRRQCEGAWDCSTNPHNHVIFTMKVETKPGKLRTTFNNVFWSDNPDNRPTLFGGDDLHKGPNKATFHSTKQWEQFKKPLVALSVDLCEAVRTVGKDW